MKKNASGNEELRKLIIEEILREGKITFAQFMELALYHPELGYYTSADLRVGRQGDFYTSPHVHPVFGRLLARQIEEMWQVTGTDGEFVIVEFGGGSGLLATDILGAMSHAFLACTRYVIVEINPKLEEIQRERLSEVHVPEGKIKWVRDLREMPEPDLHRAGCILSNELIDAFPAHRVKQKERRLREIYVGVKANRIVEVLDEPSTPEIERYLAKNSIKLADGQEIEVNLRALSWLEEVATFLDKGFVLTIDYGYESRDLAGPRFFNGSLLGYRRHEVSHNPYEAIGKQDLTSHVNFTALMNRGEEVGLAITGYTTQMNFLLALACSNLGKPTGDVLTSYKEAIALKQLMAPGGMGEVFKVLIQHKGLGRPELTGLKKPW